ncbi:MAG: hypothetical protein ACOCWR_01460 [Oceanidesulfovibrio sp.]
MQDDSARPAACELMLPVSLGDFLDRLTILEIRAERLPDHDSRAHAARHLDRMRAILDEHGPLPAEALAPLQELRAVNASLWDKESAVRRVRAALNDPEDRTCAARFCALAQEILAGNERRAALKKTLDQTFGHTPQEKHY